MKFELNTIELKNNLEILKDGLNEIKSRFLVKYNELNHVNQGIRDIRKYNETRPFDFTDISKDNDINLKQFLNVAENNVILYQNEPIFNIIVDAGQDNYLFILKGEIKVNGEENSPTSRFYKDVEELTNAIEK